MTNTRGTWTITRGLAGAGAVALLAAGCGGGSDGGSDGGSEGEDFAGQSAAEITAAAAEDMKALESVRIAGDITTEGQPLSLDMQVSASGDCQGTMGIMGGSAELISTDGSTWFKPDEAFWRAIAGEQAEQIMGLVGDKWVVMPPEQADLASLCDLDELLDSMESEDEDATKGDTEDVDGQEAVIIESESDEGDSVEAWVATDDPHHILKMEVTQGAEPGTLTFSDFDEELDVQPPADDEVIDFSEMAG